MTRVRIFAFLLLLITGGADRAFGCESIAWNGDTYQICRSPGDFRAAARAAGVTDLGTETFGSPRLAPGLYPSGVFSQFYDEPFGARFVASNSPTFTVEIAETSRGKMLRGRTGFYDLALFLGPIASHEL